MLLARTKRVPVSRVLRYLAAGIWACTAGLASAEPTAATESLANSWLKAQSKVSVAQLPQGTYVFTREAVGELIRPTSGGGKPSQYLNASRAILLRFLSKDRFEVRTRMDTARWAELASPEYLPENFKESWYAVLPLEVHIFDFSPPVSRVRVDRLVTITDHDQHPLSFLWLTDWELFVLPFLRQTTYDPGMTSTTWPMDGTAGQSLWVSGWQEPNVARATRYTVTASGESLSSEGSTHIAYYNDPGRFGGVPMLVLANTSRRGALALDEATTVPQVITTYVRQFTRTAVVKDLADRLQKGVVRKDSVELDRIVGLLSAVAADHQETITLTLVDYDPTPLALKDIGMRHDPRIATPAPVEYHDRNEEWNQRTPAPDYRRNPR
jgi:hypothetical protein